jgi:hypothetical protein
MSPAMKFLRISKMTLAPTALKVSKVKTKRSRDGPLVGEPSD